MVGTNRRVYYTNEGINLDGKKLSLISMDLAKRVPVKNLFKLVPQLLYSVDHATAFSACQHAISTVRISL